MEKRPIIFSENINWKDRLSLFLLVFFTPVGLILLLSRRVKIRRSGLYETLILFAVWSGFLQYFRPALAAVAMFRLVMMAAGVFSASVMTIVTFVATYFRSDSTTTN